MSPLRVEVVGTHPAVMLDGDTLTVSPRPGGDVVKADQPYVILTTGSGSEYCRLKYRPTVRMRPRLVGLLRVLGAVR